MSPWISFAPTAAFAFALCFAGCARQGSPSTGDAAQPPPESKQTALRQDAGTPPPDAGMLEAGAGADREACVDRWLGERGLDPYGHPEGTMYTGGTPLFDERTGERKDRLGYVLGRQPEAARACPPEGGEQAPGSRTEEPRR